MSRANYVRVPAPYSDALSSRENKLRDRGSVRCSCGDEVNLDGALYPPHYAASCDGCGQLFNLSGQELAPRAQWEEDYGDDGIDDAIPWGTPGY